MDTLHILHAGVVKKQVKEAIDRFRVSFPQVEVNACAAGSVDCARRALSGEPCDLLILADHRLIELLLCPELCDSYRIFAGNRMVLQATHADAPLTGDNWLQILSDPDTRLGHFDPQADPGGYRALFCCQLADYVQPGLGRRLLESPNRRVVDHDHVSQVDYLIYYYTAALQDDKPFAELPELMDLSSDDLAGIYASAHIELESGETVQGTPVSHALSIPKSSRNPELARDFVDEFLRSAFLSAGFLPRAGLVHCSELKEAGDAGGES